MIPRGDSDGVLCIWFVYDGVISFVLLIFSFLTVNLQIRCLCLNLLDIYLMKFVNFFFENSVLFAYDLLGGYYNAKDPLRRAITLFS
jgi:hypothetical protein